MGVPKKIIVAQDASSENDEDEENLLDKYTDSKYILISWTFMTIIQPSILIKA